MLEKKREEGKTYMFSLCYYSCLYANLSILKIGFCEEKDD